MGEQTTSFSDLQAVGQWAIETNLNPMARMRPSRVRTTDLGCDRRTPTDRLGCRSQKKNMGVPEHLDLTRVRRETVSPLEAQRLAAIERWGLLEADIVPIFEEATQKAAEFLGIPICTVGIVDREREYLRAGVGLDELDLPPHADGEYAIARADSLSNRTVATGQVCAIRDTASDPDLARLSWVRDYGIRAYLGLPLHASDGCCVGTLAVMDLAPRTFRISEIQFLEMTARWMMSEVERRRSLGIGLGCMARTRANSERTLFQLKLKALEFLTQELRNPLTTMMGMAQVLNQEVYGPVKPKQKEYLNIIYSSGEYLLSLIDQILALRKLDDAIGVLNPIAVDVEMLCQQAIDQLDAIAKRRDQEIHLSVEPGDRIWRLDKTIVRQILYHLLFKLIQVANPGGVVRVHVSRKGDRLKIALWLSHPWLDEGLPPPDLFSCSLVTGESPSPVAVAVSEGVVSDSEATVGAIAPESAARRTVNEASHEQIGLLLSCDLAELHGGTISIEGSSELGYRYVLSLPRTRNVEEIS
ncbi:GAF domain-containing sensor histidine kinase [Oxynema aestuarii]|uniref:histidine kinase n=1 Tax=Oxynema aestuarii AP17 TaxID=2064643 RepID=A0A6H1U0W1_9CYAN|nr:GAF domain-containing sensor histidine kinase [Oxynema aestuarii]QIZ71653.1 GAF domain-containing sensor histidine kinase [Oxynema aestuarii AP17]